MVSLYRNRTLTIPHTINSNKMTWKIFQTVNLKRMIITMFKQLNENKNKELNEISKSI